MSAVIAAVFAVHDPERVRRLVLNGFPLLTDAERAHFGTFYFGPKDPVPAEAYSTGWGERFA